MAKDKNQRYANTIELAKALNTLAFGNPGDITFHTMNGTSRLKSSKTVQLSRGQTTGLVAGGVVLLLAIIGVFLLRNQLFAPDPTPSAEIASTEVKESPTPLLIVVTATLEEPTASSGPGFAPACSANDSLPAPVGKETDNFCVQKIPYAYAMMAENATFTVLDSSTAGSKCRQEAIKNGEKVASCTGPSFAVVDLEICQAPELSNDDLAQCSEDNTYNSANQCCVQLPPEKAACKTIKIQLKGCGG
jgi:hypothetical protein